MLDSIPGVEVVGYATNGEEGVRRVIDLHPDLVTLDLEMPKMDGFTTLRIIMTSCPTPVIVISARSEDERVFKALELGAVDFIAKPTTTISDELLKIQDDLYKKVTSICNLNMAGIKRRESILLQNESSKEKIIVPAKNIRSSKTLIDVVAIGASTGGPPALQSIFSSFRDVPPFAIVVSQHMPAGFTKAFADRLNRLSVFEIMEAKEGDEVIPGRILVSPGGKNLLFKVENSKVVAHVVEPSHKDKYVPSVDAMFSSCAENVGSRMMAVVLTGMGNDGAKGVRDVKSVGGKILAESEESSVVFGMPREAIQTGLVDKVVPIDKMAREIYLNCGLVPKISD
jgi:two-component system chemotaxis response regulator CheB